LPPARHDTAQGGGDQDQAEREHIARVARVVGLHQIARVSDVTFPSGDLYPAPTSRDSTYHLSNPPGQRPRSVFQVEGDDIPGLVEAHIFGGRDVFITTTARSARSATVSAMSTSSRCGQSR
jgi:hypothetical protein